jgi:hypothetical protein
MTKGDPMPDEELTSAPRIRASFAQTEVFARDGGAERLIASLRA